MKEALLQLLLLGWLTALCVLLLMVSAERRRAISQNQFSSLKAYEQSSIS